MGKKLRIRCILIALVFAVIAASGVAVAFAMGDTMTVTAFRYGEGTLDDPYRIYTATQLMSLQEVSASPIAEERTQGKYFVLCNDIKLAYRPGETKYGFCGTLDGNGHTVTTETGRFLFLRLKSGAVVKNVRFAVDLTVGAYTDAYGVFGRIEEGALFTDCTVSANIKIDFEGVAAQAAKRVSAQALCYGCDGKIANSTFTVNISGDSGTVRTKLYISGVAHTGIGSIENCTVNGNIDCAPISTYTYIAGISQYVPVAASTYLGKIHLSETTLKAVHALYVYALGRYVTDGKYVGDIASDCQYPATLYVQSESAEVQHDGSIVGEKNFIMA